MMQDLKTIGLPVVIGFVILMLGAVLALITKIGVGMMFAGLICMILGIIAKSRESLPA